MASAFGMYVTATPHKKSLIGTLVDINGCTVRCLEFEEGVRNADVVSMHCPLTDETRGMINGKSLALFKPGAILLNVARGPVINEADVRAALDSGLLGGYGTDVVCVEPMLPDNPLLGAPNCVITTAGHALDAAQRIKGLEIALPIHIGDNVWIGANVTILPGVSIGSDTIIAAGSVVSRDIPESVIAAGVPCHIIRRITEADQNRYPVYRDKTSR